MDGSAPGVHLLERGRTWQGEYWLSAARDCALSLACRNRGLASAHGRGYDDLPTEVGQRFVKAFVSSLERDHWLAALRAVAEGLLAEGSNLRGMEKVEPRLRVLEA